MTPPTGLETLHFGFHGGRPVAAFAPVLVGVVGSGNLEVLLEPAAGAGCTVVVETSARGFGPIWAAVLQDFFSRHPLAGVQLAIHDMGATPAVVSLRLQQAVAHLGLAPGALANALAGPLPSPLPSPLAGPATAPPPGSAP